MKTGIKQLLVELLSHIAVALKRGIFISSRNYYFTTLTSLTDWDGHKFAYYNSTWYDTYGIQCNIAHLSQTIYVDEKNSIKSVFLSRYARILARYHTCQLTYLKISSMNLWLVTNHMTGFRIWLSDWPASRKFMEEILSWKVRWQAWCLAMILCSNKRGVVDR